MLVRVLEHNSTTRQGDDVTVSTLGGEETEDVAAGKPRGAESIETAREGGKLDGGSLWDSRVGKAAA